MIVSNSSPLIALSRIGHLQIFASLFGKIYIPTSVYQETVIETQLDEQRNAILASIQAQTIEVIEPILQLTFRRKLGLGEQGVLALAVEQQAKLVILDDKRARNEARELGVTMAYTSDILRQAAKQELIPSYTEVMSQLEAIRIFLPEGAN